MLIIYGWDENDFRCVPCLKAKRLAQVKEFEYEFVPLAKENITDEHKSNRIELEERLMSIGVELKTLPQIFDGDELIGGWTEFKASVNEWARVQWERTEHK